MSTSTDVSPSHEVGRWGREAVATLLAKFLHAEASDGTSQRTFEDEEAVPRTTLQHWLKRQQELGLPPEAVVFFESPAGLAFLHQLLVAMHLVLGWLGGGGIRLVCQLIELCGLDRVLASSYGVHQRVASQMQEALVDYGQQERTRLGETMPHRRITVAEDETFLSSGICLVAMEPVSGFVLVEEYADQRDAETWNAVLDKATKGLDVEVVQSTADEARALARHAKDQDAHHSPDLFHVQNEVNRAMALPLLRRQRDAQRALEEAALRVDQIIAARDAYRSRPRGPGRPLDFEHRIEQAKATQTLTVSGLEAAKAHRQGWLDTVRELGRLYHPYDLETGAVRSPETLAGELEVRFSELRRIADEAELSIRSRSGIDKAARVAPKMVETQRFFHDSVQQRIEALELPAVQEELLRGSLVPAAYLLRVIGREKVAERRTALQRTLQRLLAPHLAEQGLVATLSVDDRDRLEQAAMECADLFQRASSCVEGRNGRLSQWEHAQRRLSPKKLQGLTVVHNYFIRRLDGTTAAERFFGSKPSELLDWLLSRIPTPARPAARRKNPRPRRLFQPA